MTLLKKFLGFCVAATFFISCKKELSLENIKPPVDIETNWEFTESGKTFKGNIDTAFITEATAFTFITLLGRTEDGTTGRININVYDGTELAVGQYTGENAYFTYFENTAVVYETLDGPSDFLLTITELSETSITGTFTGTVKGGDGNNKIITNGRFTASIGKEDVVVIAPNPADDDYLQLKKEWMYTALENDADNLTITNTGEIDINGTIYQTLKNNRTGEERYIRKEGNKFFEYAFVQLGGASAPTELEIPLLEQDAQTGDNWKSDPYILNISGMTALAQLVTTVTNRDFSSVIDGVQYDDLIEVETVLYVSITGDVADLQPSDDDKFRTTYAKGVGVVQYFDYNLGEEYYLKSFKY